MARSRVVAWPELLGQPLGLSGPAGGQLPGQLDLGYVYDKRIVSRPALGGKDPAAPHAIKRVGPQPVNGFGRKGHQLSGPQQSARCVLERGSIRARDQRQLVRCAFKRLASPRAGASDPVL